MKSYKYDAFGNEVDPDPSDPNPFRYAGEYYDKETGNIYLRARYYDPASGRMLTEDAYRGKPESPLSRNLYIYANDNPVMYVDPSGNITILAGAIAAGIGGLVNAGVNLGGQLIANGGDFNNVAWGSVGISFVSGAVGTGLAVATCGASAVASNALTSTVEYLMYNGLSGDDITLSGVMLSAGTGGISGKLGAVGKAIKSAGKSAGKSALKISDSQFGKKIGKHAQDFGLDPSDPASRDFLRNRTNDIFYNATEIRQGEWMGLGEKLPSGGNAPGQAKFYIQGKDVVITDLDGNFVSIMKDGVNNKRVQGASVISKQTKRTVQDVK